MDRFQALDRLEAMADAMAAQFPVEREPSVVPQGVWVRLEDAMWVEAAIRMALDPKSPSRLDEALGLTGSAGRPRGQGNALICQTWVEMGAKLALELDDLKRIAMQACRSYPKAFSEAPTVRQVRSAIFAEGGGFNPETNEVPALTSEAIEAVSGAIQEGVQKLAVRRLAEDVAERKQVSEDLAERIRPTEQK